MAIFVNGIIGNAMKTQTIQLPDYIDEKDVKMQLAANLHEKGIVSSGQALAPRNIAHFGNWNVYFTIKK